MKIRAKFLAMAQSEIKAMIPPYLFAEIKREDPKPLFKAYVVGQEGKAESTWVGVGKIVKHWFKDAIGKIARLIYPGLKLFQNHVETNDPDESRSEIGKVVGSRTEDIDGKFSAVIAAYIYPEFKSLPLDIASIEANIILDDSIDDDIHAVNIEDVTGIALGNSKIDKPGFPGATLLGELQAFAGKSKSTEKSKWQLGYKINRQITAFADGEPLKNFEYLIHHIETKDGVEEVHHCFLYDHIANLYEQGHLEVKNGKVLLDGKVVKEGTFHVIIGFEKTQEIAWGNVEAEAAKIKPKHMRSGMTLKQKAREW